ncbi:MAG: DinB family protein [Chitinophagales bacterium]|nr:DinB family protein [Chitinophagales bacterium]
MKAAFDLLHATRKLLVKSVAALDLAQLNIVPDGFNNSIAWNIAHILVTQQLLHYKLSGKDLLLDDTFVDRFRKGTKASSSLTKEEWESCLKLLPSLAEELERDYFENKFLKYTSYPTSYGYEIDSIEDAIQFNNLHEALHLGYIMSMKRSLT